MKLVWTRYRLLLISYQDGFALGMYLVEVDATRTSRYRLDCLEAFLADPRLGAHINIVDAHVTFRNMQL